ncbi:SAM-dependent DNA methyltransferase [Bacteroides xylanisolvens]|jgi:sfeI DNA methyltransferase|uniref:site-specific DNA-methyltransferase (adenine-specific) n=2 Tax=Bacteroides TaxID=816 RepID=A0A412VEL3_9BACE|nr:MULTISPECIES: N-6 DNA methylase [Bacteroides]MBT9898294.1 N-6 DNA methylase [Bacteroides thetaiotaomicron]RGV03919.1 SAM-dependent DNA methyltransferase [Bacteroides xylanisolvens]
MRKNSQINISTLLKRFSIEEIEKQLIYNYIIVNNLDYTQSAFLVEYFNNYIASESLSKSIEELNHYSFEDITNDMELLIPVKDRKTNGAFFTPSYIVDYIIETVNPQYNNKVIDLSCGSGAFILGLLKYYVSNHKKTVIQCIKDNIYGVDILDYNIKRCKLLIVLFGLIHNEIVVEEDINIHVADSLKKKWEMKFDVVVGNPPYVKFQDLDENVRDYLLNNWETTKLGTYNLYFAFFELGLKVLKENGKLGYITPNNYFTSLSGEYLRAFFQSKKCVYKIIDFSCTKVFDVQTYTAITFLNKKYNEGIEYDKIEEGEKTATFLKNIKTTVNLYSDLSIKKWRLLCDEERKNIYAIENSGDTLNSLFNICVGIATLKDDAYTFIPLKEKNGLYYVIENGVEYTIEIKATRPLVKISEMKCQKDIENNQKRIIFPYRIGKDNKPLLIDETEFEKKFPKCYEYLLTKKNILENRGKGNHVYKPFYAYGRTQTLNKKGVKILTPTFSQYPRFLIDNHSEGLFTNGYGIYPDKQRNASLFSLNPIAQEENFDVVQKILNSSIMDYYVKKTSVSIEGGYPCYQKNFIERFTIPNLTNDEICLLRTMDSLNDIDCFLMRKYQIKFPIPKRSS